MQAVIIAGGAGTRFWPLSRARRPKQLLPIVGERPLIADTIDRLDGLVRPEDIWVVTHGGLRDSVSAAAPMLRSSRILTEPEPRNTAAAIAFAASVIREDRGDAEVIAILPADHFIRDGARFRAAAEKAAGAAATGSLVVLGVEPTRPETGYGYIRSGLPAEDGLADVEAFVEKPDRQRALSWLADGQYLWNSGMLFTRVDALLAAVARYLPDLSSGLPDVLAAHRAGDGEALASAYASLPDISIDYGVLERSEGIRVLPVSFGWSDVGHWDALPEIRETDREGNVRLGDVVALDCTDCVLVGHDQRVLAAVGLRGMVVVDSEDALLVAPRDRVQEVRAVVERLKSRRDALT
ncbi:MAG: mannose-1-phosphate guanylyltransferase [Deltaproteobacteria bacterium]|nr:MAG: mannose-1-phosphate guanylyltransferase [Deltaproteobacteria bacterium]